MSKKVAFPKGAVAPFLTRSNSLSRIESQLPEESPMSGQDPLNKYNFRKPVSFAPAPDPKSAPDTFQAMVKAAEKNPTGRTSPSTSGRISPAPSSPPPPSFQAVKHAVPPTFKQGKGRKHKRKTKKLRRRRGRFPSF